MQVRERKREHLRGRETRRGRGKERRAGSSKETGEDWLWLAEVTTGGEGEQKSESKIRLEASMWEAPI